MAFLNAHSVFTTEIVALNTSMSFAVLEDKKLFSSSVMYRVTFVLLKFGISGKFYCTVLMLCVAVLESPPGFLCSFDYIKYTWQQIL